MTRGNAIRGQPAFSVIRQGWPFGRAGRLIILSTCRVCPSDATISTLWAVRAAAWRSTRLGGKRGQGRPIAMLRVNREDVKEPSGRQENEPDPPVKRLDGDRVYTSGTKTQFSKVNLGSFSQGVFFHG
jgi:hypothetical protein